VDSPGWQCQRTVVHGDPPRRAAQVHREPDDPAIPLPRGAPQVAGAAAPIDEARQGVEVESGTPLESGRTHRGGCLLPARRGAGAAHGDARACGAVERGERPGVQHQTAGNNDVGVPRLADPQFPALAARPPEHGFVEDVQADLAIEAIEHQPHQLVSQLGRVGERRQRLRGETADRPEDRPRD